MNILLIHGSGHDRSCWDLLVPHLEDRGFRVRALSLGACGDDERSPFSVSMHTWANDICTAAESVGAPTVLLGHSMGGYPISLAGEKRPELFNTLIYLSAIVPKSGGARILSDRERFHNDRLDELAQVSLLRGSMTFRPQASEIFASECSTKQRAWAASRICRHPLRPIISRFRWSAEKLGSIPKHYIECTLDRAVTPAQQRALQTNMQFTTVRRLESDHSPFLSMPERLAALIAELSPGAWSS